MSMNIKNERVHDLARQAAALTGRSQTSVVEEALRRYLEELQRDARREAQRDRTDEILAEMRAIIASDPERFDLSTDFLYDPETGLPA